MSNPHFTHAIAETHRAEMYREAGRRQLAAEAGHLSPWNRLIALVSDRRATAVAQPVISSAPLA